MGKETLSARQADQIIHTVNDALMDCKRQMETKSDDFLEDISELWEDKNAVEFAKKLNQNYVSTIGYMNDENNAFCQLVSDIATKYIRIGNMDDRVTARPAHLEGKLAYEIVQKYFLNSENEDDFGLKEANANGLLDIVNIYNDLYQILLDEITNLRTRLDSINAFGNPDIKQAIIRHATNIVTSLNDYIKRTSMSINDLLQQTVSDYIAAGRASLMDFYVPSNTNSSAHKVSTEIPKELKSEWLSSISNSSH